jgi:hypothetical protein
LYDAGFDSNWEADVFGAIRSSVDAAAATTQVREADLQDVLVSLAAEVALDYINVRSTYEVRVLAALQEIEDALTGFAQEQTRRDHLDAAAIAAEDTADLSPQLYTAGLRDFRDVLDAQRSLLTIQDSLVSSTANVSSNLVRVYKGGWRRMGDNIDANRQRPASSRRSHCAGMMRGPPLEGVARSSNSRQSSTDNHCRRSRSGSPDCNRGCRGSSSTSRSPDLICRGGQAAPSLGRRRCSSNCRTCDPCHRCRCVHRAESR